MLRIGNSIRHKWVNEKCYFIFLQTRYAVMETTPTTRGKPFRKIVIHVYVRKALFLVPAVRAIKVRSFFLLLRAVIC